MSHEQFLLVAANLLHRALVAPARTRCKQVYRELAQGRVLALSTVELEDKSTARFGLSLDTSEFRGRINFGAFRASLETLIANIAAHLKAEKPVTVFNADERPDSLIFGITGATLEDQQPNVLVLGCEPQADGEVTVLRLMYLDPAQFEARAAG
ncbi:MAG: hypothetical protein R3E54_06465 [Halioglobus sp.]